VKKAASNSNKGNHRRLLRQNNSSLLRHCLPALPHQRQVVPARYNNTTSDQHRHITTTSPPHQRLCHVINNKFQHTPSTLVMNHSSFYFFFGFALII
jgi:hypothetical protein